jgi:hypothetical protein
MIRVEIEYFYSRATILFLIFALFLLSAGCRAKREVNSRLSVEMPSKILWAWERPEDLRFIDSSKFGVAFLAQTLIMQKEDVVFRPRRQPLEVTPGTYLIAVTRIETVKENNKRATLSGEQKTKLISLITKTLELPDVKAVQIDFDATVSERNFYKSLVVDLQKQLPENIPLTMTSLASWCVGDAWFNDFPIDEAVPMAFEMGADDKSIRNFLEKENDWREPLCRGSYGISVDAPLNVKFKSNRRFYYFKAKAWQESDLEKLNQ